jgi:hypothetical protein
MLWYDINVSEGHAASTNLKMGAAESTSPHGVTIQNTTALYTFFYMNYFGLMFLYIEECILFRQTDEN